MKIDKIEGTADELAKFCTLTNINKKLLLGDSSVTEVKGWYFVIPVTIFFVSLSLVCLGYVNHDWQIVMKFIGFMAGIAIIAMYGLKFKDTRSFWVVLVGVLFAYLLFTNVMTPVELLERSEKHIPALTVLEQGDNSTDDN